MSYLRHRHLGTVPPLHDAVGHAYYHNAFYRRKLDAASVTPDRVWTDDDLGQLPFTTRDEIAGDPWVLLAEPRLDLAQVHVSTGSSGERPVYVLFSWDDLHVRGLRPLIAGAAGVDLLGIKEGERVINALPYEVTVTGLAIHRALQDGVGACVVPAGKGGWYADPARTLRLMRALEADHLFTTPSYALHLAELDGAGRGDSPAGGRAGRPGLGSIWLVGEGCAPALRRLIERRWRAPARLYYGSLECGPVGLECALQDGYHVATGFVAVEIVPLACLRRSDLPGPPGEIVVTVLWRRASPLLRFRTGDAGYWDPAECGCGIPGRRLKVLGRLGDRLGPVGPERFVSEVEDVLLGLDGVSPWFRLVPGRETLGVLLPQAPSTGPGREVVATLAGRLGLESEVAFVPPEPYPGGKLLRVVREAAP
jgi:phenylacetate-CoA ligase